MINGIIFDFDGVIADSEPIHFETFRKTVLGLGIKLEKERWPEFEGTGADYIMKTLFEENKINADPKEWIIKRRALFSEYIEKNAIPLKKGLIQFLQELEKRKIKMAIASGSRTDIIGKILEKNNIANYFTAVCGADFVSKRKPDPEVFLLAAKKLSLRPSECLIIEDSISGISAAKKANINCICMHTPITAGLKECMVTIKDYTQFPFEILEGKINDKA
ncbi:MAG: HAD family phosphatase [Candidatus Micrarchaeia archaeon]